MKKSYVVSAILAVAGVALLAAPMVANAKRVAADSTAKECKVVTNGTLNGENGPNRKFVVTNNKAFISFTVKGKKCQSTVQLKSWYSPSRNGTPHPAQVKFQEKERTLGPGKYTMGVDLPPKNCFYQVDFVRVPDNKAPGEKNEMLGFTLNGKKNCIPEPKMITVCVLATKEIKTINQKNFDATKHTLDLSKCKKLPQEVPGKLVVCDLQTKEIVTIDEEDFDESRHTEDQSKCDTPEVPETPKELPQTGLESLMSLVGASSLAGSASYYIGSRRRNA